MRSRIDTLTGEQFNPEFVAINPQHCIPTLVDGSTTIWDSHAICAYLTARYANQPAGRLAVIAPNTAGGDFAAQRARFDHRLHFHHGTLFNRYYAAIAPIFQASSVQLGTAAQLEAVETALGYLEKFLTTDGPYVCGAELSVADILYATTVSSIETVLQLDVSAKFPGVHAWSKRVAAELPGYAEIETAGVAKLRATVLAWIEKNKSKQ